MHMFTIELCKVVNFISFFYKVIYVYKFTELCGCVHIFTWCVMTTIVVYT